MRLVGAPAAGLTAGLSGGGLGNVIQSRDVRIVVVSLKGGVGKTTTAVYLASVAARGRRAVTVVDADPQGSAAIWLEGWPVDGVDVREAPSDRLLRKALDQDHDGAVLIVDTPPGSERLTSTAVSQADVVVIPTRIGGVEGARLTSTLELVPDGVPSGVVVSSARPWTRDFRETLDAWAEQGVSVWGVFPERVGIAAGPETELHVDGLEAAAELWQRVSRAARRRSAS
jgi:chromosome partitioning protein